MPGTPRSSFELCSYGSMNSSSAGCETRSALSSSPAISCCGCTHAFLRGVLSGGVPSDAEHSVGADVQLAAP
eukprot:7378608-Prymnesium_polylepis.1